MTAVKKDLNSWVAWVFDHPVTDPAWHWDNHAPEMELAPSVVSEYVASLFQNPKHHLDKFSDDQLAQAIWFLVSSSASNQLQAWFDESVSWESRRTGILATETLFREVFAVRCANYYTPESNGPDLDTAVYMWWDIITCSSSRPNTDSSRVHSAYIDAMSRILKIESMTCQYSALHGLGHWLTYDEKRATLAIDAFLSNAKRCDPRLLQYAKDARTGNIA